MNAVKVIASPTCTVEATTSPLATSTRTSNVLKAFYGIICASVSSIFFSLTTVIVKHLTHVHPGQLACFRFLGILLFAIPMVFTANVNPFGPKGNWTIRAFLLLRGFAGASSLLLRYSALRYLPIANATVIILSMPVFVCIFARVFLKESCGIFHIVSIAITLLGIAFTSKLDIILGLTSSLTAGLTGKDEFWGLLFSMGATLIGASVYIFVRKVKECHNSVIMLTFAIVAIGETSLITEINDGFVAPTDATTVWLLIALAILSFYAQLLLTKSLQLEEASIVSVIRASCEVVCAFVFQILFFGQRPDGYAIVGSLLVTSSVLLTSSRKWITTLPKEHLARKLLSFTLK